ncbi:MAG: insulinase family protein [Tannerella sp.]|jgi:zinc protease|nr:insulinase family protein [Tannerella sp.]
MNRFLLTAKTGVALCLLCFVTNVFSQEESQGMKIEKLIMDPALRYGKLKNGLTYYIRHNEMPQERAEFYLVHNVGSMQEEENQRGLAHFLEHMAFNGSKNFPSRKGMQDYIESIGMRMGENLNAYTGFDETVYLLMDVPVVQEGIIDSCLLILHDWSAELLLEDEAIEKERGVIREEWRTSRTAQSRLWEQQLPKMFPGSKYGTRLPIGSIDVINNFKGDELRAYYKKWYRPDLQAIVIVGDIDVDKTEEKIKRTFSGIPAPVHPEPRELALVPDNNLPLVSVATDKEMTNMTLSIYYKHEKLPYHLRGTIADFIDRYSRTVISLIMSERFSEILQKANPPFVGAYADDGDYFISRTKGAWTSTAIVKPGELERAMGALVAETERVKKFGFTQAEYERARENILSSYESTYKDRDKLQNSSFAEEYVDHFTKGVCIPGIETEYELIKSIVPEFPVEGINQYLRTLFGEKASGRNIVISLSGPDKEDVIYPAERELLDMFYRANKAGVSANEEEAVSKILIPQLPEPGKIIEEKDDPLFGVTLYTLSNGVRVVVKQTDYKKEQILMTATSPGGVSLFKDDKDIWNLKALNNAMMLGGLGEFSATGLRKAIAGKKVSSSAGIGISNESMNGSSSPSDLKTLFELIYLQFTGMRTDDEAYASFEERMKTYLDDLYLNPMIVFSDSVSGVIYDNNPRTARLKSGDFSKIDYHRMIEMYKERFADASDFVFTFVGNVDKDSIRPLLEQYMATLPSLNRTEKGDECQVTPFRKGKKKCHFSRELETPKSSVALMYTGEMPYNLKNAVIAQLLNKILDGVYAEKVREEKSASYDVRVLGGLDDFPEGRMSIQIYFDTDPKKQDEIIRIIKSELEGMAKKGPREEDLEKSRRNIIKGRMEAMQENSYWLNVIDTYYYRNFDSHTDYDKVLNEITVKDIRSFTRKFLDQGNEIEVVMSAEKNNKKDTDDDV